MHEVLHYSRLAALRQSIRCNASYDERCDYKNLWVVCLITEALSVLII